MAYQFGFGSTATSMLENALSRQHQEKLQTQRLDHETTMQENLFDHQENQAKQEHLRLMARVRAENEMALDRMGVGQRYNLQNMGIAQEYEQENMTLADDFMKRRDYRLDAMNKERIREINAAQAALHRMFLEGVTEYNPMARPDYLESLPLDSPVRASTPTMATKRRATANDALSMMNKKFPTTYLDVHRNLYPQLQYELGKEYQDLTTVRNDGIVSRALGIEGLPMFQIEPDGTFFNTFLGNLFLGDKFKRAHQIRREMQNPIFQGSGVPSEPN